MILKKTKDHLFQKKNKRVDTKNNPVLSTKSTKHEDFPAPEKFTNLLEVVWTLLHFITTNNKKALEIFKDKTIRIMDTGVPLKHCHTVTYTTEGKIKFGTIAHKETEAGFLMKV